MAFRPENLSALTYANGFTLWHYKSNDLSTDVDTAGYFNRAATMLRPGDILLANLGLSTAPSSGLLVVLSNTNGVVDVANMTVVGSVNSD